MYLIFQQDGAVLCSSSSSVDDNSLPPPPEQASTPIEASPLEQQSEPAASGSERPTESTSAILGSVPAEKVHQLPYGATSGIIRSIRFDPQHHPPYSLPHPCSPSQTFARVRRPRDRTAPVQNATPLKYPSFVSERRLTAQLSSILGFEPCGRVVLCSRVRDRNKFPERSTLLWFADSEL